MIPLFLLSIYISNHIETYFPEGKFYSLSENLSIHSYIKEDFLYLLGFLFILQTFSTGFSSIINTLLLSFFIELNFFCTYDSILFEINRRDLGYILTLKDILLINYIFLSFFLSKLQLMEIFLLFFLKKYFFLGISFIDNYYPIKSYFQIINQKGSEIIKKIMNHRFLEKKKK